MNIEQKQKIRARLRQLRDGGDARYSSNNTLASAIGVSSATVHNALNDNVDKWPKLDKVWEDFLRFLRVAEAPKRALPLSQHMNLPVTRLIQRALREAHQDSDVALIYGFAGAGKTHAATQYAKAHSGVVVVTMSTATRTVFGFLLAVARQLGVDRSGSAAAIEAEVLQKLHGVGGERLLVVDEAHHLRQEALDEARGLYDSLSAGGGFGLALIGNMPVLAEINKRKAAAQIISRIGRQVRLERIAREDVAAVVTAAGGDVRDRTLMQMAMTVARRDGGIRRLVKVLRNAILEAQMEETPLAASHIATAEAERIPAIAAA